MPEHEKNKKELISLKKGLTFIVLILALSLCFGFCAVAAGAEEPAAIDNDAMFDIVRETCTISSSFWEDAKYWRRMNRIWRRYAHRRALLTRLSPSRSQILCMTCARSTRF